MNKGLVMVGWLQHTYSRMYSMAGIFHGFCLKKGFFVKNIVEGLVNMLHV